MPVAPSIRHARRLCRRQAAAHLDSCQYAPVPAGGNASTRPGAKPRTHNFPATPLRSTAACGWSALTSSGRSTRGPPTCRCGRGVGAGWRVGGFGQGCPCHLSTSHAITTHRSYLTCGAARDTPPPPAGQVLMHHWLSDAKVKTLRGCGAPILVQVCRGLCCGALGAQRGSSCWRHQCSCRRGSRVAARACPCQAYPPTRHA